ncbi:hypothetical protein BJV77DRAFT_966575 [Russula vinacea]|nr:hypothetical protein BJV77DRAFT_966575 [Russula vinacea]
MTGSLTRASRGAARGPNLRRFELLLPRSCPRLAVGEEGEEGDEGVVAVVQKTMDSTSTNKWPIAVGSEHRPMNSITAPCLGIRRFLHRGADLSKIHLKRQIESESYEAGSAYIPQSTFFHATSNEVKHSKRECDNTVCRAFRVGRNGAERKDKQPNEVWQMRLITVNRGVSRDRNNMQGLQENIASLRFRVL